MPSLNKVILMGHLGRDPDLRYTGSGKEVANVSLATNDGYGDNKKTTWHNLLFWGKQAEVLAKYCGKGDTILVEGRIDKSKYTDKQGAEKEKVEVVVSSLTMIKTSGKDKDEESPSSSKPPAASGGGDDFDDDIPFSAIRNKVAYAV